MAKVYLEKLSQLMSDLQIDQEVGVQLEAKHFFTGAALFADEEICASWSPGGLAFKIVESDDLIACGKAKPLRYSANGRMKKGYAMFENPEAADKKIWKNYFLKAIQERV
mgnify:CR=1 FL=1